MILGIPFGADRATAERAYSQRSRVARRGDGPHSVDDVNWAMNQVEAHLDDPTTSAGTYRIPAHLEALRRPHGPGLFRPPLLPLARRTPVTTPEQVQAVIDEARKDALDHLLARAATDVKRKYGLGGDAGPIRPVPLNRYPRRARSKVPLVVTLVTFLVLAAGVGGLLLARDRAKDVSVAPTTTLPPPPSTAAPTTTVAPTTTLPPTPGLGDPIEQDGNIITPVQPLETTDGFLCLLFQVEGAPPLDFVPAEAVLIADVPIEPNLDYATTRAQSGVVFGEPEPTEREVCWPLLDFRSREIELLYTLNESEYRWLISDGVT